MIRFRLNAGTNSGPTEKRRGLKLVALSICFVGIAFALLELAVAALLHTPGAVALLPEWVRTVTRSIYRDHVRNIVSLSPTATTYHPDLFYTLKPQARFLFSNIEFSVAFTTNSLGVRDDENSLSAPEVVVLGDSFAMGWGVAQDETFPKILQKMTDRKTLNASISSYGTVREMRMLNRVDTSGLRFLVIAYCDNDYRENRTFLDNANKLDIQSKEILESLQAAHAQATKYYFGKYSLALTRFIVGNDQEKRQAELATPQESAAAFLNAVRKGSTKDLSQVQIIVFENKVYTPNDGRFGAALRQLLSEQPLPPQFKQMTVLDLSRDLGPEAHFVLDDHMNERGHRTVATRLAPLVGSRTSP